jgi:tRNA(His) 5'-end guanylyltransferase
MGTEELGDRMKRYEGASLYKLPIRMPIILRVDGKCFQKFLGNAEKPYDFIFRKNMDVVGLNVIREIQGAVMAYLQSDEISFLITPYTSLDFQPWFDNEVQKMASVGASLVTKEFNALGMFGDACFDARVFVLPKEEVVNYFIWRQRDWETNSLQMLARSLFSHKEVENKSNLEMKEMVKTKGEDWDYLDDWIRRGRVVFRNPITVDIPPRFEEDRGYINKLVYPEPEEERGRP